MKLLIHILCIIACYNYTQINAPASARTLPERGRINQRLRRIDPTWRSIPLNGLTPPTKEESGLVSANSAAVLKGYAKPSAMTALKGNGNKTPRDLNHGERQASASTAASVRAHRVSSRVLNAETAITGRIKLPVTTKGRGANRRILPSIFESSRTQVSVLIVVSGHLGSVDNYARGAVPTRTSEAERRTENYSQRGCVPNVGSNHWLHTEGCVKHAARQWLKRSGSKSRRERHKDCAVSVDCAQDCLGCSDASSASSINANVISPCEKRSLRLMEIAVLAAVNPTSIFW